MAIERAITTEDAQGRTYPNAHWQIKTMELDAFAGTAVVAYYAWVSAEACAAKKAWLEVAPVRIEFTPEPSTRPAPTDADGKAQQVALPPFGAVFAQKGGATTGEIYAELDQLAVQLAEFTDGKIVESV